MDKINVLVTGVGGGVGMGIIKSLRLANRAENVKYSIIGADMNLKSAGIYLSDRGYCVPSAKDPNYPEKLLDICKRERVDIILCGSQDELEPFSNSRELFEKQDIKVLIATKEVIEIGLDKSKFYEWQKRNKIPYPRTITSDLDIDGFINEVGYPLVMKPIKGAAAQHLYFIKDKEELNFYRNLMDRERVSFIIQEFLKPKDTFTGEYTVGVLNATDGELLGSIAIQRERKHPFSTWNALIEDYKDVRELAEEVANKLGSIGPSNVQIIRTGEGLKVFEINTRFSGTSIVRAMLGFNDVHAAIQNFMFGKKRKLNFRKDIWMFKYQSELLVPFKKVVLKK